MEICHIYGKTTELSRVFECINLFILTSVQLTYVINPICVSSTLSRSILRTSYLIPSLKSNNTENI